MKKEVKLLKTAKIILIIFVISIGFLPATVYGRDNLQFRIIRIDNSSLGNARRFTYHVVINPGTTKSEMEQISLRVLAQAQRENPFNVLAVGFYDHAVLVGHEFRFGRVEFAPNGRWADANTVRTGDYSTLRMVNLLREPDWDNALTKREAKIFARYNRLLNSLLRNANTQEDHERAEREVTQRILKKYKISQEELNGIFQRYRN